MTGAWVVGCVWVAMVTSVLLFRLCLLACIPHHSAPNPKLISGDELNSTFLMCKIAKFYVKVSLQELPIRQNYKQVILHSPEPITYGRI